MSQKAAARHCGVGEVRWRQVEKGFRPNDAGDLRPTQPGIPFVIDIARGLNWDIGEALTLAGYDPGDVVISDEPTIEPPAAMAENWNKISNRARKLIKELVDELADRAETETVEDTEASSTVQQSIPPAGKGHTTRRKRAQKG
jgi:hypothetical protein